MKEYTVSGQAHVGSGDLDQDLRLKPTSVFRLFETLLPDLWRAFSGVTREAYFAKHPIRLVFSYLNIERTPTRLELNEAVTLEFTGRSGRYPGRDGTPRYGLKDQLMFFSSSGEVVLRWNAAVYWVELGEHGAAGFLPTPAPELLHEQSELFDAPPPRPQLSGSVSSQFRWTPRETDFNRHVYFQSYLERAENALADLGLDSNTPTQWSVWFSRPAFLGDVMQVVVEPTEHTPIRVGLQREDGSLCALIEAS